MRICCLPALSVFLFLAAGPARAIVIETGPNQRVAGHLELEEEGLITLRVKKPDGKEKVEVFERSKIKIIHKIDRQRLKKMTKDNPSAYRKYADELAAVKTDPEAMDLAPRLYLIAAYLDPPHLGRACLLGMSTLASRPADARKYRAMAYLLDPKGDPSLLKVEGLNASAKSTPEAKAAARALSDFQKALRSYRSGQLKAAKESANEKGVNALFAKAGLVDQKSFLKACNDAVCPKCKGGLVKCTTCNGKGKITDAFGSQTCVTCNGTGHLKCKACDGSGAKSPPENQLRAVLRAEVWAIDQVITFDLPARKSDAEGWSRALASEPDPAPLLTLESISEFDPRQCIYRNGQWVAP